MLDEYNGTVFAFNFVSVGIKQNREKNGGRKIDIQRHNSNA
jgi:hypothetical protein